MLDKDAHLDEDKPNKSKQEVKMKGEFLKSLSFHERMRGLSLHRRPLENQMRYKPIFYIDLLEPGPPPLESSKKCAKRK